MNNEGLDWAKAVLAILAFFVGTLFGAHNSENSYQEKAIEMGYAHHCPDTGDWAWKGECATSAGKTE